MFSLIGSSTLFFRSSLLKLLVLLIVIFCSVCIGMDDFLFRRVFFFGLGLAFKTKLNVESLLKKAVF